MLRQRIEHGTTYTYRRPVAFGRHRLVLRPREGHDLFVENMTLSISPAHELVWARDVFNNSVVIVDFVEQADRLEVKSSVIVRRALPFPRKDPWEPWRIPLPVVYDSLELPVVFAYQSFSYPADTDTSAVRHWLRQFPEIAAATDAETMLNALCSIIHRTIRYQRREAKGVQSPSQTLQFGSGSCRDMATLMMDATRSLGIAARFVSGYLDCPAAEAGRAAMHAWTEVYLPVLGWRGFDPTLAEETSLKHIAVGVSHHPRGVMPISGLFTGAAADYIEMTAPVKVERIVEKAEASIS
jgi:transglutaminase-like putative cysteine protease